jgi:hypothetical protein
MRGWTYNYEADRLRSESHDRWCNWRDAQGHLESLQKATREWAKEIGLDMPFELRELSGQTAIDLRHFTSEVNKKAKANGITVYKGGGKSVTSPGDNVLVAGYFCDESRKLAVATGDPDWVGTFAHEASHMDQFVDGSEYWTDDLDGAYEVLVLATESPDKVSQEELKDALNKIVLLEADCERRTIEKIKQYKLPVDLEDYARKANAYLYWHTAILYYRKWYSRGKSPTKMGITKTLPTVLQEPEHYLIGEHDVPWETFAPCYPKNTKVWN